MDVVLDGLSGDYPYGPAEDRVPPTLSSIFRPSEGAPMGLVLVERNHEAPYIGDFVFE